MRNTCEKCNPCIDCMYAVPKIGEQNCCWAERYEPVEGWIAKKAYNRYAHDPSCKETYAIEYCPKFKIDPRALTYNARFEETLERMEAAVRRIVSNPFGMTETEAVDCLYSRAEVSRTFQPAAKVLTVMKLLPPGKGITVSKIMERTRLSMNAVANALTILTGWGWIFEVDCDIIDCTVTITLNGFDNPQKEVDVVEQQNKMVLDWLKEYGTITAQEAVEVLNIYRLSARIYDLRAKGHKIRTTSVSRTRADGRRVSYAKYHLED